MLIRALFTSAFALAMIVSPAGASLQKYLTTGFSLAQFESSSPKVALRGGGPSEPGAPESITLIDDSGANPVLRKYVVSGNTETTSIVPALSGGFIWYSVSQSQGPVANEVGTGSTASSIDWGNVDGWTVTGGTFCNAVPSFICTLAEVVHLETVDPVLFSTNYDFATWTFHGTGFMQTEYVFSTGSVALGNAVQVTRGSQRQDGTVPAIPLLGIGAVSLTVLAMGITATRRKRS